MIDLLIEHYDELDRLLAMIDGQTSRWPSFLKVGTRDLTLSVASGPTAPIILT